MSLAGARDDAHDHARECTQEALSGEATSRANDQVEMIGSVGIFVNTNAEPAGHAAQGGTDGRLVMRMAQ